MSDEMTGQWRGPGRVPPSAMRVSDAERHEVVDLLSQHFSDGRLDQAELDERMTKAMAAKTRADLGGLLNDLPPLGHHHDADPPHRRHGGFVSGMVKLVLAIVAFSWFAHLFVFWHGWAWGPPVPLLVFAVVALLLVRRARHGWRRRSLDRGTG